MSGKKVITIISSVLLAICLIGFIFILSVFGTFGYDLENVVDSVIEDRLDSQLEDAEPYLNSFQEMIKEECANTGEEAIIIEFGLGDGLEFDCSEVESSDKIGFEEIIKDKANEEIGNSLEKEAGFSLKDGEKTLYTILWILGILSLIFIGLIIFLARLGALINLGIVGLVSGSFFLISWFVESGLLDKISSALPAGIGLDNIPILAGIVEKFSWLLFRNYLIVFVIGIILLGLGIGMKIAMAKKEIKENVVS